MPGIKLRVEAYKTRSISFIDLWEIDGMKLKVYWIAYGQKSQDNELIDCAEEIAKQRIAESVNNTNHYGVGFVGIHAGKDGNFIFIDWWANENELFHHVYVSSICEPTQFKYVTPSGLTACVWDLYVIGFEREAWIENVLTRANKPDLDAYLLARLNENI